MSFSISYHPLVEREDIPRLSIEWKNRIKRSIERKLSTEPETFGKPLRKSLTGYRKLRVGDYRVVFRIENRAVKIFIIAHRSRVYQDTEGRI